MIVDVIRPLSNPGVTVDGDLFVDGHLHYTTITQPPSPYWAGGNFNTSGEVFAQKGIHAMTVTKVGTDSAYDVVFPAHPDGARFTCLHASTEYHSSIRSQTSVGFRIYTRKSNNAGGVEGTGEVSLVVLI